MNFVQLQQDVKGWYIFRIVKMVPCNMFSDGVWKFYKASVHYMSNLSHWDVTENCTHPFMKSAKLFKIVKYFQCQYFPFQIRFMFKTKQDIQTFIANWISSKEVCEQKIELLAFFHDTSVILHSITRHYKTFNKPGSYFYQQNLYQY